MTVKELHRSLTRMLERDESLGELDVYAEYDYGDNGHTQALVEVRYVEMAVPVESAYSASGFAVRDWHDEVDEKDGIIDQVVILRSTEGR